MLRLWQFIVTMKCFICLETINYKKDSSAAGTAERTVLFHPLLELKKKKIKPNDYPTEGTDI